MPFTRSQARAEKEMKDVLSPLEKENKERLAKSKELQKNAVVEDDPSLVEAEKWRKAHQKELGVCLKDPSNRYRCPTDPIFEFFILNEEIQQTGNPWLLSEEGYSPSSFTYEILGRHWGCLNAWRKWRGHVPRPE